MNLVTQPLHVVVQTDWWPTLLDGFAGGFLGALGAFLVALYVVHRQSQSTRGDRRIANAQAAVNKLIDVR